MTRSPRRSSRPRTGPSELATVAQLATAGGRLLSEKQLQRAKDERICFQFLAGGCSRKNCEFKHEQVAMMAIRAMHRDSRINELRDAGIVTAKHVDTKLNLADRLTKGLSHVARQALDREMDEIRRKLIGRAGAI